MVVRRLQRGWIINAADPTLSMILEKLPWPVFACIESYDTLNACKKAWLLIINAAPAREFSAGDIRQERSLVKMEDKGVFTFD